MILTSLKLRNIRSYLDADIPFPKGSVLLAGDIGCGKSTILLAIEFALFGTKASELPGTSLLRHGKKEGWVELSLTLDGKDIIIKRTLKRSKQGVNQDAGYIIINGMKKECMPKELRAQVFGLLGYPRDLISKSKDLIYRYTVYTPQEAMKEILYEKTEERLDTLRKVFNIEKYKRIRDNAVLVLSAIKEQQKELEGYTRDLEEKKKELEDLAKQEREVAEKLAPLKPKLQAAKKTAEEKTKRLESKENKVKEYNLWLQDFRSLEAELNSLLSQRKRNTEDIARLEKETEALAKEVPERLEKRNYQKTLAELEKRRQEREDLLLKCREAKQQAATRKAQSEETKQQVTKLDNCPLCRQDVTHDHKSSINAAEDKRIKEFSDVIAKKSAEEQILAKDIQQLDKETEETRQKRHQEDLLEVKTRNLASKREELDRLKKWQEQLKKDAGQINMKKLDLGKKLEDNKQVEEEYQKARKLVDEARTQEHALALEVNGLEKELAGFGRYKESLRKDLDAKQKAVEKLGRIKETRQWLYSFFMNLMFTIEKHVMLQINREFNELFKNWFSILMEDETLSVRLDEEFTPLIEQNGYETAISNLSGGEKTAVALAYRLSLNKVINDVVGDIKTKDIIMLDEPTDGFSAEQLDKVREILGLLNIEQIIIVSHEAKIESFVESVVRVSKQDHVSSVLA